MKNLYLTFCLVIAALFGSVGGGFASDLPNCPASGYFDNCFGTYTFSVGHKYVGDWNYNKQDGRGIETWASGKKYVGEFRDGKRNGQGTFNFASGNKYVGEYKDGKKDGQGTYTWTYGDKYAGEYKDGKRNGQGTYTYANGTIEEGIWEDGKFQYAQKLSPPVQVTKAPIQDDKINSVSDLPPCPSRGFGHNCFGTYTAPNGETYVGEWQKTSRNGQGATTWASGNKYVGEYKDDKRDGQGTYTYANGDKYFGEYKDDNQHGQGTYTYANGTIEEGFWEDGKFQYAQKLSPPVQVTEAPTDDEIISLSSESDLPECINSAKVWHYCFGNLLYENGDKYVGDFEENKKHGHGTYDWANGDKYVGEFKKDMQNGLGVYTQSDGTIEDGIYLDDELLYIPSLIIRWFRGVKG